MDVSIWFYIAAVVVGLIAGIISKKWEIGVLAGYVTVIFSITVFTRPIGTRMEAALMPFWSYSVPRLKEQIIFNIIGFIPVGFLGARMLAWKAILMGIGISVAVEMVQFFSKTGLFEVDDIIHNSIGAAVGVLICMLIAGIKKEGNNV